jgi:hypothetical protein
VKTFALDLGSQDETKQTCHAVAEILGSQDASMAPVAPVMPDTVSPEAHKRTLPVMGDTPGELRSFGGVLVSVPANVEVRFIQQAVNYLLLQMAVREGADQGGT